MPTKNRVEKLDDLARSLVEPMPRRRAVRLLVAGLFGVVVTSRHQGRASSHLRFPQLKNTPCIDAMCSRGRICGVDSLPNKWGQTGCIKLGCCTDDQFCCAGPATAHGAVGGCCSRGFNCDGGKCVCNGTIVITGVCDCAPERICGTGCCKKDDKCIHDECCAPARICGSACCKQGETCIRGQCCPAERVCGSVCCKEGDKCVRGQCCPPERVCTPDCDCSHLKGLQTELSNAEYLQRAFQNKIPDLQKMSDERVRDNYKKFAKDLASGVTRPEGDTGPDSVDYSPWGERIPVYSLGRYSDKDLCKPSDSTKQDLDLVDRGAICTASAAAVRAHEKVHQEKCESVGYSNYFDMHPSKRAAEEAEAYSAQIAMLRDAIKRLSCP